MKSLFGFSVIGIKLKITLKVRIIKAEMSIKKKDETYFAAINFRSTTITSLLKYAVLKLMITSRVKIARAR